MAYAQAGDEQQRQLDPNATTQQIPVAEKGFADFLRDNRASYGTSPQVDVQLANAQAVQTLNSPTGLIGKSMADLNASGKTVNPAAMRNASSAVLSNQVASQRGILEALTALATQKLNEQERLDKLSQVAEANRRADDELAAKKLETATQLAEKGYDLAFIEQETGIKLTPAQSNGMNTKKIDALAEARANRIKAGIPTDDIDAQLKELGVDPNKPVISKNGQILISELTDLLNDKSLDNVIGGDPIGIRGVFNSLNPKSRTVLAKIKKIQGLIDIGNAVLIKGTGQISDGEREMLSRAGSILGDIKQDPKAFKEEMRKILINAGGIPPVDGEADLNQSSSEWEVVKP